MTAREQPVDVAAIRELLARATPMDEFVQLIRYDHGGGRLFRETDEGTRNRKLIADFYEESDRELFYAMRNSAASLLDGYERAQRPRSVVDLRRAECVREAERRAIEAAKAQRDAWSGMANSWKRRTEETENAVDELRAAEAQAEREGKP